MAKLNTEKLLSELIRLWGDKTCPYCGGTWSISSKIFELREYNDGNLVVDKVPIQPVVPITCKVCGNTVLVNPLVSGTIEE